MKFRFLLIFAVGLLQSILVTRSEGNTIIVTPQTGIGPAVATSSPGDTILVSPGVYAPEFGAEVNHSVTVIGMGGAGMNVVKQHGEGTLTFLDIRPGAGPVYIEGLTITRFGGHPAKALNVNGSSPVVIKNCVFHDLNFTAVTLAATNVLMEGNVFYGQLKGIQMFGGSAHIMGNTFAYMGNSLEMELATPLVENNIFAEGADVVCIGNGNVPTFACNDAFTDGGNIYVVCTNPTGTNGNISVDPLFCDPSSNDFRLQAGSPCLPEHSPPGCGLIGALGSCAPIVGVPDPALALLDLSVTPNPFRGRTRISFSEGLHDPILEIYDPQGRVVNIVRPVTAPFIWEPGAKARPGVYFIRLRSAETSATAKFVLLPR